MSGKSAKAMIEELIRQAVILPELQATSKEEALEETIAAAQAAGAFNKRSLKAIHRRLAEREALGSTGIGNGVAVPHVKGEDIKSLFLVLARSVPGIDFQAIDGRPVHMVFLLGSPADRAEDHLQSLRWVSGLARNADFRRFFLDADGEAAIRDLLLEMSS